MKCWKKPFLQSLGPYHIQFLLKSLIFFMLLERNGLKKKYVQNYGQVWLLLQNRYVIVYILLVSANAPSISWYFASSAKWVCKISFQFQLPKWKQSRIEIIHYSLKINIFLSLKMLKIQKRGSHELWQEPLRICCRRRAKLWFNQ